MLPILILKFKLFIISEKIKNYILSLITYITVIIIIIRSFF